MWQPSTNYLIQSTDQPAQINHGQRPLEEVCSARLWSTGALIRLAAFVAGLSKPSGVEA